jgi:DNA polymerase III epsilon subunit-like protein
MYKSPQAEAEDLRERYGRATTPDERHRIEADALILAGMFARANRWSDDEREQFVRDCLGEGMD